MCAHLSYIQQRNAMKLQRTYVRIMQILGGNLLLTQSHIAVHYNTFWYGQKQQEVQYKTTITTMNYDERGITTRNNHKQQTKTDKSKAQEQHNKQQRTNQQGHVAWADVLNTSSWTCVGKCWQHVSGRHFFNVFLDSQACSMFTEHNSWTRFSNTLWLCPWDPGSPFLTGTTVQSKIITTRRSRSKMRNCYDSLFILTQLWIYKDIHQKTSKNVELY